MGLKSPIFELTLTGIQSVFILPKEIVAPFLKKGYKRVFAKVSFEEKQIEFHAAIQKRKDQHVMMMSKKHQEQLGLFPNDYFQVQFFEDTTKYGVKVPEEFEAVLNSDPMAQEIFNSFTRGKQRGIIYMVKRFTKSQARIDKSLLICENLKKGVRNNLSLLKME